MSSVDLGVIGDADMHTMSEWNKHGRCCMCGTRRGDVNDYEDGQVLRERQPLVIFSSLDLEITR